MNDKNSVYRLSPCPSTPNCVSSDSPGLRPLVISGDPKDAMNAVRQLMIEQKRTRIISQKDWYIHAEVRSAVFRFVDDVEFLIDNNFLLQFRSAARIGRWDLGVNRRRMVRLCNGLVSRYDTLFRQAPHQHG